MAGRLNEIHQPLIFYLLTEARGFHLNVNSSKELADSLDAAVDPNDPMVNTVSDERFHIFYFVSPKICLVNSERDFMGLRIILKINL